MSILLVGEYSCALLLEFQHEIDGSVGIVGFWGIQYPDFLLGFVGVVFDVGEYLSCGENLRVDRAVVSGSTVWVIGAP